MLASRISLGKTVKCCFLVTDFWYCGDLCFSGITVSRIVDKRLKVTIWMKYTMAVFPKDEERLLKVYLIISKNEKLLKLNKKTT